ncbi:hypothetical protein [Catenulispora yoronensis]|uniref:hypothetical protein n=1 Tax=Catenulispora yoronensis TaxID=450799 RepID=UPI0031D37B78
MDPRAVDPKALDPKARDPKALDPKALDPQNPKSPGSAAAPPPLPGGWHAVVYGRTPVVDSWWRVRPAVPQAGSWLEDVVHAVVAHGKGLEDPRCLLAQTESVRLVGVACRAAELSDTMNTDTGGQSGRALYVFVGWLAQNDGHGFPPTPDLPTLLANARAWASPVYETWAGLTWNATRKEALVPQRSSATAAPWRGKGNSRSGPDDAALSPLSPLPLSSPPTPRIPADRVLMVPESEVADVWSAALPTARPTLITTGWKASNRIPRRLPMCAGVEGLAKAVRVELERAPEPPAPPPPIQIAPPPTAGAQPPPPEKEQQHSRWNPVSALKRLVTSHDDDSPYYGEGADEFGLEPPAPQQPGPPSPPPPPGFGEGPLSRTRPGPPRSQRQSPPEPQAEKPEEATDAPTAEKEPPDPWL